MLIMGLKIAWFFLLLCFMSVELQFHFYNTNTRLSQWLKSCIVQTKVQAIFKGLSFISVFLQDSKNNIVSNK